MNGRPVEDGQPMMIGDWKTVYSSTCYHCPRCGEPMHSELDREGEIECGGCGAVFDYEIEFAWTLFLKKVVDLD